ncbi:hypothetical protein ACI2K4_35260 [Micromonospora sp. NPDC050397]|uniref:hypothetical protein n=1 Tax=Micromonospora sp. NPDC050397 TaxID=3364279 RepID=UPI00384DEBE9
MSGDEPTPTAPDQPAPAPGPDELEPPPTDKSWIEMDHIRGGNLPPDLEHR